MKVSLIRSLRMMEILSLHKDNSFITYEQLEIR